MSHFTGKERDAESGLDNFGARYFTSSMGRFMSPDWAARPTTVPYAVFGDPQSLNLYGYVRNDPVSRADADGHGELWDKFKKIWYAKVSVGAGLGGEVKLTKYVKAKAEIKGELESKKTSAGETTTVKAEASVGAKAGHKEAQAKASAEVQVEKDGKVDVGKPKVEVTATVAAGTDAVKGKASLNEIGVSGHYEAFGAEVGASVDNAKDFGQAVKQHVDTAIDDAMKKLLPIPGQN